MKSHGEQITTYDSQIPKTSYELIGDLTFKINATDLILLSEGIFIEVESELYAVESIETFGSTIIAKVGDRCWECHSNKCKNCGFCHIPRCRNSVKHCWN